MKPQPIRVLIVDDSSFQREALAGLLETDPCIQVVGYACNGQEAVHQVGARNPDVITMDIQMPVMDGFRAIEQIMTQNPRPIIVTSSVDPETLARALSLGAMDYIAVGRDLNLIAPELIGKVKIAARITPIRRIAMTQATASQHPFGEGKDVKIIVVGVSTGGPSALMDLFSKLPVDLPAAILVTQHMLEGFTEGMVKHLQGCCPFNIEVATPGCALKPGTALIAPDHCHMRLAFNRRVELVDPETISAQYVPSADILMQSVARAFRDRVIGVVLTGMGQDGVAGIRAIKRSGGMTVAQDEATSVVFGMNRMAIESGCVDQVVPIQRMADHLVRLCIGGAVTSMGSETR